MTEVLAATPLNYSVATQSYDFPEGISIREISPILWDVSIVNGYVSEQDKHKMNEARFWLCAAQEYEYVDAVTGDELYTRARNAAFVLTGHTSTCAHALTSRAAASVRVGAAAMILAISGS